MRQQTASHSAEETKQAGRSLARRVQPGDVVLLEGPLGSGKTTFVQGIAEGLGAETLAPSPSFVIVNEYALGSGHEAGGSRPTASVLRHIDLYRLTDSTVDLERIGLQELVADKAAITVIEWADRMPAEALRGGGSASRHLFRVRFRHGQTENERILDVEGDL